MAADGELTKDEKAAAMKGGEGAGAYLESIGVFDLRQMNEAQWATFCATLYRGACDALREQADDEIPF